MALMLTDLPEPVVPATSRCGILPMSAITGTPAMSLPRARVSGESARRNCRESRISFSRTVSRCSLGISMPTTDLPGITSTMRTLTTARERARSFAKALILLTFVPLAGSSSKRVTTGPGSAETTLASTRKSASRSSSRRDMSSSSSLEKPPLAPRS